MDPSVAERLPRRAMRHRLQFGDSPSFCKISKINRCFLTVSIEDEEHRKSGG
jgi:hypothetical protein